MYTVDCNLYFENVVQGGENMLCHMVIDLSDALCTRSDAGTKPVQR